MSTLVLQKQFNDLTLYKYKKEVFFNNLWNTDSFLQECRGLVVDKYNNIVALPFRKVFNYLENGAGSELHPSTTVVAVKKINGFMLHVTKIGKGNYIIGTTGSLDSEFVRLGKEMLHQYHINIDEQLPNRTYIYEICSKKNKHIIDEKEGVYLTGIREFSGNVSLYASFLHSEWNLDIVSKKLNATRPEWYPIMLAELIRLSKYQKHEGWMVRGVNGCGNHLFKLKTKYYLTKKWIQRGNSRKVFNSNAKEIIDEEYYKIIDLIRELYSRDQWDNFSEIHKESIFLELFNKIKLDNL